MELNQYRHFYLYAKGKYQTRANILDDLRIIQADYCGLFPDSVSDRDIIGMLSRISYPHIHEGNFEDLIFRITGNAFHIMYDFDDRTPTEKAALAFLSILMFVPVYNDEKEMLLNLGAPDPDILPLKKKESNE